MSRTLLTTLLPLVLGSCTVGPHYQKPDTADITPAKWTTPFSPPSGPLMSFLKHPPAESKFLAAESKFLAAETSLTTEGTFWGAP